MASPTIEKTDFLASLKELLARCQPRLAVKKGPLLFIW
jgi:hypothetical protein